jgi:iron(III) transport system substrate-binding protein
VELSDQHPHAYEELIDAARQEGELVVYSVTSSAPLLVEDFRSLYPDIKLNYIAMDTLALYERVTSESEEQSIADVAWSSAMDLQLKLVNDGYAMTYVSPEISSIPDWAVWQNQAFGTSYEPVGIVYNSSALMASDMPQTRRELADMLLGDPDKFEGKVVAFDPIGSGLGYLLMTQDAAIGGEEFWRLIRALGSSKVVTMSGSGAMFSRIGGHESLIGYNLLGSYARARARKDIPTLGLALPRDYTLVMSRVMFILRDAPHPNAAKLWLDYTLSPRGQKILAESGLGSVRSDIEDELTAKSLAERLGSNVAKPIEVGPGVLANLSDDKRSEFLMRWRQAINNDQETAE